MKTNETYYPDDYSGRYSDPEPPQEIKKECEHLIPADKFRIEVTCTLCGVRLRAEWKPVE